MAFVFVTNYASLNQALFRVTHGLYIVTAASEDRVNGQCLDALMQVTNAPPRIAVGIGKRSLTHEMIAASGRFAAGSDAQLGPAGRERDCVVVVLGGRGLQTAEADQGDRQRRAAGCLGEPARGRWHLRATESSFVPT